MARSLAAAAIRDGAREAEVSTLARAYSMAMVPRVAALEDDHHPAYLHPGRSALILLRDVGGVDVSVLSIAAVHESQDGALRLPVERVEAELGPEVAEGLTSIPLPGDERLVERLVGLGPALSLAALAERLDHLRHLHVRDDLAESWTEAYDEAVEAWLPFASRVHETLARRYTHWARRFVRRI